MSSAHGSDVVPELAGGGTAWAKRGTGLGGRSASRELVSDA